MFGFYNPLVAKPGQDRTETYCYGSQIDTDNHTDIWSSITGNNFPDNGKSKGKNVAKVSPNTPEV